MASKASEIMKRTLAGVVFVPIFVWALLDVTPGKPWFTIIIAVIGLLCYYEIKTLLYKLYHHSIAVVITLMAIYMAIFFGKLTLIIPLVMGLLLWETFYQLLKEKDFSKAFHQILVAMFIVLYLGVMLGSVVMLATTTGAQGFFSMDANEGAKHLAIVVVGTWMCDIGAYFVGSFFGRHVLPLAVSPRKTVEGLLGGIIISGLSMAVACHYTHIAFSPWFIIIPFATIVGDLLESLIKRVAGAKDSSNFIPGHGGVLDVFDALIFTAPLYYYAILPLMEIAR